MSFYDDASIVLIPSGYKTSKLYSQKPTDGSGDLTFTRTGSTATRVNESGLIERCRTNLALYSEDLTNAAWSNFSINVIPNDTISPNGNTTADKIIPNTSNANHLIHTNQITSAGEYSFSIYVKSAGYSKVAIRESFTTGDYTSFNLTTGTIIDSGGGYRNTIISVGNGWYRITTTKSYSGNIALGIIPLLDSYTSGSPLTPYVGNGTSGIFVWGAQIEFDVPTTYIPTTSAAVTVGPIANLPRLDYTGGGCPKLLMEPTRTNLFLYSQQFNNSYWLKNGCSITSNNSTSIDGYVNADKLIPSNGEQPNAGNGNGIQVSTSIPSDTYTISFFAKAGEHNIVRVRENYAWGVFLVVNLTTGAATIDGSNNGQFNNIKTENYGNGWWRISFTTPSGLTNPAKYSIRSGVVGDGSSGLFIYGAQLEAGSYATSYIPTFNASVTRNQDQSLTTGKSALIGTEFTLFLDAYETTGGASSRYVILKGTGSTYANFISIESSSSNKILALINNSSSVSVFSGGTSKTFTNGERVKLALRCKNGDFAYYANGVLLNSQASGSVPTTSDIYLGYYTDYAENYNNINSLIIFNKALSNSDLVTLTTI